jgi:hypothetical protein
MWGFLFTLTTKAQRRGGFTKEGMMHLKNQKQETKRETKREASQQREASL